MPNVLYWVLKKSDISTKPHTRYRFKNFIKNQWQKESNTQRFERNENQLILFFLLLFRRGIEIAFQRLRVFVHNCSTIVTVKKALFHVISLLGNLVIAYRTNLVVIMPRAFRTFHDQCPVHIRVLTMFTGTFRVKGGGHFRLTTFSFLTRFQCRLSSGCLQLHCHSQKPLPLLLPPPGLPLNPMNSPNYYSRSWTHFLHFGSIFPFLLRNRLATFYSWLNLCRCQYLCKSI